MHFFVRTLLTFALFAQCFFSETGRASDKCGDHLTSNKPVATSAITPSLDLLAANHSVSLPTPRLILRTPKKQDLAAILPIFQDYLTVRYTWFLRDEGFWTMNTIAEHFEWQATEQLKGNRRDFVIQLSDQTGTVIGRCALYQWHGDGSLEFGITIYRPFWGNGYAGEVMKKILGYAFNEMGATEILFRTEPENIQMLQQYEKLGIPKTLDAKDDIPEPPFFHHYHRFVLDRALWLKSPQFSI